MASAVRSTLINSHRKKKPRPSEDDEVFISFDRDTGVNPHARPHAKPQYYEASHPHLPRHVATEPKDSISDNYGFSGTPSPSKESSRPTLYRKKDESSASTMDMEVEMRHVDKRPPGQGHRTYRKYEKAPSSDSVLKVGAKRTVSAYSTLSVKSWTELNSHISLVEGDIKKHFKPIFDKHGSEGVSVQKLKEELNSRRSQHLMGRESINERLRDADKDGDEYLSFEDFLKMVTQDLKQERKLAFRGMLLSAIGSIGILPKEKRDNFLANYKICPPPLFIPIISIIQMVIFAAYVADMDQRGLAVTADSGYPSYSPLHYTPRKRWQAWRFLTYMFIHDGYMHIIFNLVVQVLLGFPLEMVHGWWRTAIIYLTGVISGSLAHSVVDHRVGLVGASGGVYAIFGAHLAAVVTNWREMNYKICDQEEFDANPCLSFCRIIVSAPVRLFVMVLLVFPDTALAIFRRVALDEPSRVGVSAHVGGCLTGLFLGIPVLRNVYKRAWEKNLGWVTLSVYLVVCAFAVFFNTLYHGYPETDWTW